MKSVAVPWYQKPILHNTDIQKAAFFTGLFSLVWFTTVVCLVRKFILTRWLSFQFVALFTIFTAVFDLYCLAMAAPGSTHYGYYIISYEFVYVGNVHVRNTLIVFALFSFVGACILFVTSLMLVIALRKVSQSSIMLNFMRWIKFPKTFLFLVVLNNCQFEEKNAKTLSRTLSKKVKFFLMRIFHVFCRFSYHFVRPQILFFHSFCFSLKTNFCYQFFIFSSTLCLILLAFFVF